MDKRYDHTRYEEKIYRMWEKSGAFTPKVDKKKKPYTIILPLPNANDPMHMGHALFVIEDILIRQRRMLGDPTLWLPGGDHAGIETQFVFEKILKSKGKSRFDYDRKTLYKMIWKFADKNKDVNKNQMKRLGFSMDWTRYHYSLEPEIVEKILTTFRKLHKDGFVYRGERIVNYCTHCGTSFSELEVNYKERKDQLYFLNYGSINIATTRPETIFADVAVAVNPKDKRYKKLVDKKATIPLINIKVPIISDDSIDTQFGTGALKVTPAHDQLDFEIGQKNKLEVISIISNMGLMEKSNRVPKNLQGLSINKARENTIKMLEKEKVLIKKEPITHSVGTCYRCKTTIEPLVIPQWFVKTKPLAAKAIKAVQRGKTKIVPKKRFEKMYFDWMKNIKDWNISRQIVWGPQIPVWYCLDCNPQINISFIDKKGKKIVDKYKNLKDRYTFKIIKSGLQTLSAPKNATYSLEKNRCPKCKGSKTLQETDTFDTWFLSGQWPLTTLGFNVNDPQKSSEDFKYFYPTSVLDTLWDILFFWVGRMMMFGLYLADEIPFKTVHLHARVVDEKGKKMSKSRGNVIDPIEMVNKYGADALRMALVIGVAPASDIAISDQKVKAYRNFSNKIWNMARFIALMFKDQQSVPYFSNKLKLKNEDKEIFKVFDSIIKKVNISLEKYRFADASGAIYHFIWDEVASKYLEGVKTRKDKDVALSVLRHVFLNSLKLLHPFMPFVTEAVWQELKDLRKYPDQLLITSSWPSV
jgi:valyl-tRNA synthetase